MLRNTNMKRVLYSDEGAAAADTGGGGESGQTGGQDTGQTGGTGQTDGGQQTGQTGDVPGAATTGSEDTTTVTAEQFKNSLPQGLRDDPNIANINDVESFAKSYVNAQQMIGKDPSKTVELPDKGDTEGRKQVLGKLGLPDSPDEYEITAPTDSEGNEIQGFEKPNPDFLKTAHEAGVLPDQAQQLYDWVAHQVQQQQQTQAEQVQQKDQENIQTLKQQWGDAFQQQVNMANQAIDSVFGDAAKEKLEAAGLGTDPDILQGLAKAGKMVAEDSDGAAHPAGTTGALTPDEARSKAKDLQRQALQTNDLSEQKRMNEEAQKYWKMVTSGK